MKITVWIRPDQSGNIDRDITMRTDYQLESLDTPTIQRYGRKLLNAIEGTAEKEDAAP